MPTQALDRHRPRYHFTAPSNWINDPNGVCFHEGRYHLYYQYNPDASQWGNIHWGHASSADLVHWVDEGIALAPSNPWDSGGCFSGSFAVVNGQPTLYYTGYTAGGQVQCVATSEDLHHWTKHPERTIATPPADVEVHDFRDPYVFQHAGQWLMVVGASYRHERGQVLLYQSADGVDWHYQGPLFTAPHLNLGVMWECPNLFPLGRHWVLTVSRWQASGAHAFVGDFDGRQFVPHWDAPLDVDSGSFAHLTFTAPDGRALQWAWINEQREQALINADGWAGCMGVPRALGVDPQGRLTLQPAQEMAQLRSAPVPVHSTGASTGVLHQFEGTCIDVEVRFRAMDRNKVGVVLCATPDQTEATRIVYWSDARRLSIERERSSVNRGVRHQDVHAHFALDAGEDLQLRVLLDASVLEVYANSRLCLSTRIYPDSAAATQAQVFAEGQAAADIAVWGMGSIYTGPRRPLA